MRYNKFARFILVILILALSGCDKVSISKRVSGNTCKDNTMPNSLPVDIYVSPGELKTFDSDTNHIYRFTEPSGVSFSTKGLFIAGNGESSTKTYQVANITPGCISMEKTIIVHSTELGSTPSSNIPRGNIVCSNGYSNLISGYAELDEVHIGLKDDANYFYCYCPAGLSFNIYQMKASTQDNIALSGICPWVGYCKLRINGIPIKFISGTLFVGDYRGSGMYRKVIIINDAEVVANGITPFRFSLRIKY